MQLDQKLKRHRFPVSIISQAVWLYRRFNHSYRDVQEQLAFAVFFFIMKQSVTGVENLPIILRVSSKNVKGSQATHGIWMR